MRKVCNGYTVEGPEYRRYYPPADRVRFSNPETKARLGTFCNLAILRNPDYQGLACFGKTAVTARQRITRSLRLRGGLATRNSANHELLREERIEIPVPVLVGEETFALAQEKLIYNKLQGPRRTIEPGILQGVVPCRQCSYALYRSSARTSVRKIYYYRLISFVSECRHYDNEDKPCR